MWLRRLRQKRQRKEQKSSSDDDEVEWVQAAMFGLQLGSTLLGGSGKAKASRTQMTANKAAISEIDNALIDLEGVAADKTSVAEGEFDTAFETTAKDTSNTLTDLAKTTEDTIGKTGFAVAGETEEVFKRTEERLLEDFDTSKDVIDTNLQKTLASIEEWKMGESERLKSEKRKLVSANNNLKGTSSIFGALGFG